jgi:hypothetical protein
MELAGTIGNGGPFERSHSALHLQCVGCDKKIPWYFIGQSIRPLGTGWSSLALLEKSI